MRNFIALEMVAALWHVAALAQPAFGQLLGATERLLAPVGPTATARFLTPADDCLTPGNRGGE